MDHDQQQDKEVYHYEPEILPAYVGPYDQQRKYGKSKGGFGLKLRLATVAAILYLVLANDYAFSMTKKIYGLIWSIGSTDDGNESLKTKLLFFNGFVVFFGFLYFSWNYL